MTPDSPLFEKYRDFVLKWEGGNSSDPDDTAASCAPYSGGVHTVRGVTYCTFKLLASKLGVLPVTYDRFLDLSPDDVDKFIYEYYKLIRGPELADHLALAMTEAAWGSGRDRAVKHLQAALNVLGNQLVVDGDFGPKTMSAVQRANRGRLYTEYWAQRYSYIDYLSKQPRYSKYRRGWLTRIADFAKQFAISPGNTFFLFTVGVLLLLATKR